MRPISKPSGLFNGRNFMTPEIIGYYKLRKGYAELSEGTGLNHQPIFGVTVQHHGTAGATDVAASQVFQSRQAARSYIEALS